VNATKAVERVKVMVGDRHTASMVEPAVSVGSLTAPG